MTFPRRAFVTCGFLAAFALSALLHAAHPARVHASSIATCEPNAASVAPPPGFNPLTASPADLRCYGFPAKPTDPSELTFWQYLMQNATHYVAPVLGPPGLPHAPTGNQVFNAADSGFDAPSSKQGSLNPSWTSSSAEWNVPINYTACGQTTNFVSPWDGIGDVQHGNLLQAGTDSFQCNAGYWIWVEFWINVAPYNDPNLTDNVFDCNKNPNYYQCTRPITSVAVYGGDEVYVETNYNGGNTATFYLQDLTSPHQFYTTYTINPYDQGNNSPLLSQYIDETDDECIVEQKPSPQTYNRTNVDDCYLSGSNTAGYLPAYNNTHYTVCLDEGTPESPANYLDTYEAETSNGMYSFSEHIRGLASLGCPYA